MIAEQKVHQIKNITSLLSFLREELNWQLPDAGIDDITFEWTGTELNLSEDIHKKLKDGIIRQLQPFKNNQPWGIFVIEFAVPAVSVITLRQILRRLVSKRRSQRPDLPSWKCENLLFISLYGEDGFTFAHFRGDKPFGSRLTTFSWRPGEAIRTLCEYNLPALEYDHTWSPETWVTEWQKAFDVEKVNKLFYKEIARLYYRLTGKSDHKKELILPSKGEGPENASFYEEFAVRLIGRTIFCWFLKHKKSDKGVPLIPPEVLSLAAAQETQGYYHAILEPLFFEVMNNPVGERKDLDLPKAKDIPFLNGGLFEPHGNDFYSGMTNYALKIPDAWFKDFFTVLEQYNFTINENSSIDVDVSVDPEMLGRIFENLLAEVNPETGETARKATGSYYTPRVIVDYMVEQSLKQYLLTKTTLGEEKVNRLLAYEEGVTDFSEEEKVTVVTSLKEIKIIDPACGSGAFPLGILHRMLLAMQKVDPKLEIWRKHYLENYHPVMRKIIEDKLRKGNEEYIRKLTIIQDSIFGVDIQPIAVEIAKLRCFLSLVVDERVFDNEENRGVEPLPNLEFKFVAANTLIGLPATVLNLGDFTTAATVKELKSLRDKYLRSYGGEKEIIETRFRETQAKLRESIEWAIPASQINQLATWDPFSYESCGWFDPEWMFGASGGFNVVIANPPYGAELNENEKTYLEKKYSQFKSQVKNSAIYFIYKAGELLNSKGAHSYIVPKSLCYSLGWNKCAGFVMSGLQKLIDSGKAFEKVKLEQVIFVRASGTGPSHYVNGLYDSGVITELAHVSKDIFRQYDVLLTGQRRDEIRIIMRILSQFKRKWADYVSIERGVNWQSQVSTKAGTVSIYRGAQLSPYAVAKATDFIELKRFKRADYQYQMHPKILNQLAIAHVQNPYPHFFLQAALDLDNKLVFETISCTFARNDSINLKFLLALNNSKLFAWLLYKFVYSNAIRSTRYDEQYVGKVPCPSLDTIGQAPFITVVDRILAITKDEDYFENEAKQAQVKEYEGQINQLVYQLYGLTPEEIAVVEGIHS